MWRRTSNDTSQRADKLILIVTYNLCVASGFLRESDHVTSTKRSLTKNGELVKDTTNDLKVNELFVIFITNY